MKIKKWIAKNLPDSLSGDTFLITGANSGIGFELAKIVVSLHGNLIMAVRNLAKGKQAKQELLSIDDKAHITVLELDLSDFNSIERFTSYIISNKIDIDYFYNNAGVYRLPYSLTKHGIETQIGINYIGTLLLTNNLVDYFRKLPHQVRICFVNSVVTYYYKYDPDHFFPSPKDKPIHTYANSKSMTTHMFYYFYKKYENTNLSFYLAHPGSTYTPLIAKGYQNQTIRLLGRRIMKTFFHLPNKACLVYAMVIKNIPSGSYITPRGPFELSGYPKIRKLKNKQIKDYQKTIEIGLDTISTHQYN